MTRAEHDGEKAVRAEEAAESSRGELADKVGKIRVTVRRLDRLEATGLGDRGGLGALGGKLIS
jgi:hypothetical protein